MGKKMKLLTLENLAEFCAKNKLHSFNSQDTGHKLYVQVPGMFEVKSDSHQGLLFTKLKVCHTLLNRNGSYISEENMKKAMPSLKYRPILAYIHQLDNGEWDFHGHDMEYVEDENGNEELVYLEKQVGSFTEEDPYLEYDAEQDKTYVMATGVIPEEYTKAAEIIRRKNGTKVSCELCIEKFSYNAKEKYLDLEEFYFTGTTLLGKKSDGTEIGEGMLGSRMDIMDFSEIQKSSYSEIDVDFNQRMIAMLEELSAKVDNLSNFTINENSKEGGTLVSKFEELLEKYSKTAEDIDFEYEIMSEEELEAKFEELFGEAEAQEDPNSEEETEETTEVTEEVVEVEVTEEVEEADPEVVEEFSEEPAEEAVIVIPTYSITLADGVAHTFELSLSDIIYALSDLVNATYSEQDNCWYSVSVYDDHLVMVDWWTGKAYKQSYKRENDNFSLMGDRVEVFSNWLTADEESALEEMRANYTLIQGQLENYQKAEEKAHKENLMKSVDYSSISDKEDFVQLNDKVVAGTDNFTFDELKQECDQMLLNYAKSGSLTFATAETQKKPVSRIGLLTEKPKKKGPYGSLKFN